MNTSQESRSQEERTQQSNGANNTALPMDRMENLIKVEKLLKDNAYRKAQNGDYIQVKVLWSSGIRPFQRKSEPGMPPSASTNVCHFIFSDETATITAIIYFNNHYDDDLDSENICQLLKKSSVCKISGFEVYDTRYNPDFSELDETAFPFHPRRVKLSTSTMNIVPIKEPVYAQIPFRFMKFEDVDNVPDSSFIDLIGYVERVTEVLVSEPKKCPYQRCFLRSSFDKENSFRRRVTLFDEHIGKVTEGGVYAFSKLKVETKYSNRSLKATYRSIIMEITRSDFTTLIPPQFNVILPLFHEYSNPSLSLPATSGRRREAENPRKRRRHWSGEHGSRNVNGNSNNDDNRAAEADDHPRQNGRAETSAGES